MVTKEAIKNAINLIPSKALREAIEEDLENVIDFDWTEDDLYTLILQCTYDSIKGLSMS